MKPFDLLNHLLLAGLAIASAGHAQQTIVVDQNGASGSHVRDLPAAIAIAARGDLIVIRAGTYTGGVVLDKAIRILGEPNSVIRTLPFLTVRGLPLGDSVTVQGLRFDSGAARVSVDHCLGRVQLSDLSPLLSNGNARLTLDVVGSTLVLVGTSRFVADISHPAAVYLKGSTVILQRVQAKGAPGGSGQAGAGLVVASSDLTTQSCVLRGGDGSGGLAGFAVDARSSTLVLAGSVLGRSRLEIGSGPAPSAGIRAVSTQITAELDSRKMSLPTVTGGATVTRKKLASLMVDPAQVGGQLRATIEGPLYASAWLVIGELASPRAVGGERLFLEAQSLQTIASAQIGMFGWWSYQTTLPSTPSLRGLSFAFQALAILPSGIQLSTPTVVTLN